MPTHLVLVTHRGTHNVVGSCGQHCPKFPYFSRTKEALCIRCWSNAQWVTEDLTVKGKEVSSKLLERGTSLNCGRKSESGVHSNASPMNEYSWTVLISQHTKCGQSRQALRTYQEMRESKVEPSPHTFVALLKACSILQELDSVKHIHADVVGSGFESNLYVGTMLVDAYAKCRSLLDATHVFEKMPHRDVVSWTAMIWGHAQMEKGEEALQLFARMQQEGIAPNDRTYVGALKACGALAASDDSDGIAVKERCLETVRAIHKRVRKGKFESDMFVGNMLVDVYSKCGSLKDARQVFENMPHRNVVSWTAMICGYVQMDEGEMALQLFTRMQQEGVVPNERTYVGALKACGSVAALEKGKEIHAKILKAGFEGIDCFVASSLVDMYGKCGRTIDAQHVFDAFPTPGVVAWSALIAGYAHQGESEVVFDLFHRMKQKGIQPDGVAFLGVLSACSHAGLVDKGNDYFTSMSRDYGINPTIKHFTCMVDLLARSGQLNKAMEVVGAMPFLPDSALWECVLSACRKWDDVELGKQAFDHAVTLNEGDGAPYILMSNIYAAAQMRTEAMAIQAMRMESGAWKQQGQTRWTDMSGVVHVFVVCDQAHPGSLVIYAKLEDLMVKMKEAGYVPLLESISTDIPDGKEQTAVCGPSDQLAIAYALLET